MRAFITGGCGFIGSNLADSLMRGGHEVLVFDNLSRRGTEKNLRWLETNHGGRLNFVRGDVRDFDAVRGAMRGPFDAVFHTAGQVAVTSSVADPREDFEVNAFGTLNVLEAVRASGTNPAVIFTSTNKVYGGMEDVAVVEREGRYAYGDLPGGVCERRALDFHSPYGCSKGAADQYVHDYARIYGMRTVVFRMSCQYGPRQFGNEDQGWVVHFAIAAHFGRPIRIYGDGKQVRDVLHVDDLVRLFTTAAERIDDVAGQVFNIGGGPGNVLSLLDLVAHLEGLTGRKIELSFGDWRPGDQRVYVSDIARVRERLGWVPVISKGEGVRRLYEWVRDNEHLFDM